MATRYTTKPAVISRLADRVRRFVITTALRDGHGTLIQPQGIQLAGYLANPIVLWNHQSDSADTSNVLGRALSLDVFPDRIVAEIAFRDSPKANDVLACIDDGIINMVSIGFNPLTAQSTDSPEGPIITWCELCEISVTPVGANPGALAIRRLLCTAGKSMNAEDACKKLGLEAGASYEDCAAKLMEYLKTTTDAPEVRAQVCDAIESMKPQAAAEGGDGAQADAGPAEGGEKAAAVELEGTRAALTAVKAELISTRAQLVAAKAKPAEPTAKSDPEKWVQAVMARGQYPLDARGSLLALAKRNAPAAEAAVAAFKPGEFNPLAERVTGSAGVLPGHGQRALPKFAPNVSASKPAAADPAKRAQQILEQAHADIARGSVQAGTSPDADDE